MVTIMATMFVIGMPAVLCQFFFFFFWSTFLQYTDSFYVIAQNGNLPNGKLTLCRFFFWLRTSWDCQLFDWLNLTGESHMVSELCYFSKQLKESFNKKFPTPSTWTSTKKYYRFWQWALSPSVLQETYIKVLLWLVLSTQFVSWWQHYAFISLSTVGALKYEHINTGSQMIFTN